MYFRCAACAGVGWVEHAPAPTERVDCETCARTFVVRATGVGPTLPEHYRAALELANACRVDLPRAYSIVLGLIPDPRSGASEGESDGDRVAVEPAPPSARTAGGPAALERSVSPPEAPRAREVTSAFAAQAVSPPPAGPAPLALPALEPPAKARSVELDPAFEVAIERGRLTVEQAMSRGDREAFARSLVQRHRIDFDLAFDVTDNRISLREAIALAAAERRASRAGEARGPRGANRVQVLAGLCLVGCFAGTLGGWLWNDSFENRSFMRSPARTARTASGIAQARGPAEPAEAAPSLAAVRRGATEVRRDVEGHVVEIVGPDPVAVLRAWCSAAGIATCVPTEITETVPRLGDARYGAFVDPGRPWASAMIWIRQDWRTRRWVAGDGKGPIPVEALPELPGGAYHQPVGGHAADALGAALALERPGAALALEAAPHDD